LRRLDECTKISQGRVESKGRSAVHRAAASEGIRVYLFVRKAGKVDQRARRSPTAANWIL
jgi:hypothetical protein